MKSYLPYLLCVATLCPLSAAAELGRLFFTPAQRANFDEQRHVAEADPAAQLVIPEIEEILESEVPRPLDAAPVIVVDGFVRRSDGRATVWINGETNDDGTPLSPRLGHRSLRLDRGRIRLKPNADEPAVSLKPGQYYDPNTDEIGENYDSADAFDDSSSW